MAEHILNSVEKAAKGFGDVMESSKTYKRHLRDQNANLRNLHDEEIQGKSIEGLDKILERKPEYKQDLLDVINLCDELKNNLDTLYIASYSARDNKGRNNLRTCDSGIDSIASLNMEDHRLTIGPHVQDLSAHTHPESSTISEESKEAVEGTDC